MHLKSLNCSAAFAFAAVFVVANGLLVVAGFLRLLAEPLDWWTLTQVPERLNSGTLYALDDNYYWIWSPLAAWLVVPVVSLGYTVWAALHVAVIPFLRKPWLIGITLVSLSLWVDTVLGNAQVFIFVSAVMAVRGNRAGEIGSLVLFALMPRPLQLPLVAWLLWRRPHTRLPFLALMAILAAVTIVNGYGFVWPATALEFAGAYRDNPINIGPTHFIGSVWLVVGIPLAVWLTTKNRIGLAGLSLSPYVLPHYLLMLLVDASAASEMVSDRTAAGRTTKDPHGFWNSPIGLRHLLPICFRKRPSGQ